MTTAPAIETAWLSPHELNDLLIRAAELQGADLRLLMYYATAVPVGEAVPESVRAIGERLGLASTSSARSVKKLLSAGWLTLAYEAAGMRFYRLGPQGHPASAEPSEGQPEASMASVHHLPLPARD
ncbi:hypothetical protein [Streptomyces sp. NPDC059533]|uniref:hypothetical protein n=1 Tax=unclassified Streptomyces TaxID=2593676 RepID=UPI003684596F